MADTPILNYKGKYDGPEIDKAVELALSLENLESCPYHIYVSLSQPDYVLTVGLGDAEGNLFNHAEIDLPLESMVVNATYSNGSIVLHLQDGTSTEPIPISALIAGLVSETRTIAGIDLRDDITQKELRDALDVYTKDSVDLLVSDLENTINETLNEMKQSLDDLSELTSEHDTQIKKNTSDIATNKNDITTIDYAVGSPSKNLFDFDTWKVKALTTVTRGTAEEVENGFKLTATDNDCFTGNGSSSTGYKIPVNPNSSYTITWLKDVPVYGVVYIFKNGIFNNNKSDADPFTFTTDADTTFITLRFGVARSGESTTYSNIMVRPANITDNTYEPYKPSINEQINNTVIPKIGSDISSTLSSVGWYRIFVANKKSTARSGLIMINRGFVSKSPENYILLFNFGYNVNIFKLLSKKVDGASTNQLVDGIRIVYAQTSPYTKSCYIDLHYNSTTSNPINASVIGEAMGVDDKSLYNENRFIAADFSTAEIPEGYTSYEFDLTGKDVFDRLTALETALSQIQTQ